MYYDISVHEVFSNIFRYRNVHSIRFMKDVLTQIRNINLEEIGLKIQKIRAGIFDFNINLECYKVKSQLIHTDHLYEYFDNAKSIEQSILKKQIPQVKAKNKDQAEILQTIKNYLTTSKFTDGCYNIAAIVFLELNKSSNIKRAKIFSQIYSMNIENKDLRERITQMQMDSIRLLFARKDTNLLLSVAQKTFVKEHDEHYDQFHCLVGHVFYLLHQYEDAKQRYLKAVDNSRGYYYLGLLTKDKKYFEKGANNPKQTLWSSLCALQCGIKGLQKKFGSSL